MLQSGATVQVGAVPIGHYFIFRAISMHIKMLVFGAWNAEPCFA